VETYAPLFALLGFRYARITLTGEAKLPSIHQVPVTSAPGQAGGFTCGVPSVNRLVLNRVRSQRSNFISTDLAPTIAALIGDPRGVQARTLFPSEAYFRRVVEDADGLVGTGFIGTPAILPALTLLGMADLAQRAFTFWRTCSRAAI
jgi:hypothetical protein